MRVEVHGNRYDHAEVRVVWDAPPDGEVPADEVNALVTALLQEIGAKRVHVDYGTQYANIVPFYERWLKRWGEERIVAWRKENAPGVLVLRTGSN